MDDLIKNVEELVKAQKDTNSALQSLLSKRGVNPSKKLTSPYTPIRIRKKGKAIFKALADVRSRKSSTPHKATAVVDLKKVNVYKHADAQKLKKLEKFVSAKKSKGTMYSLHELKADDFRIMTSMEDWWLASYVDEIMLLMCVKQSTFTEHYASTDIILDLNFYNIMLKRYTELSDESTQPEAIPFKQMLDDFIWDDDVITYCRGTIPARGGREWVGAKRVLSIMNINVRQFVTLEFIIEEGVIDVYDCNLLKIQDDEFFIHIQPDIELWPKLLKQSDMFEHLPEKLLNEDWEFVLKENLPRNEIAMACRSYSLAFIEHLLTDTNMIKPETLLCDNSVARM